MSHIPVRPQQTGCRLEELSYQKAETTSSWVRPEITRENSSDQVPRWPVLPDGPSLLISGQQENTLASHHLCVHPLGWQRIPGTPECFLTILQRALYWDYKIRICITFFFFFYLSLTSGAFLTKSQTYACLWICWLQIDLYFGLWLPGKFQTPNSGCQSLCFYSVKSEQDLSGGRSGDVRSMLTVTISYSLWSLFLQFHQNLMEPKRTGGKNFSL